ncbi:MAG: zinc ribbon domain-containing protein [Crocosphaera sp.]
MYGDRLLVIDICIDVNPKWTSQKCSHCGHIQKENRSLERFLCLNCGFLADAECDSFSLNLETGGRLASVK